MSKDLVEKFENDIKKRSRLNRILLVFDQFLNVLFWNGSHHETISSHIGRKIEKGTATWFDKTFCCFLKKLDNEHCAKSNRE